MEILETERLELVPLHAELLRMWTEDIPGLEKRLGCIYKAEPMEGMFLQIVGEQLKITEGYMTEAVKAMCGWAFSQEGVRQVTAETDKQGTASQRVLKRCGFVVYRQEETLWWKCLPGVHGME